MLNAPMNFQINVFGSHLFLKFRKTPLKDGDQSKCNVGLI